MDEKQWLILLLGVNNYAPIRGKLLLQKEMFLIVHELDKSGELKEVLNFESYKYGPYSTILEGILDNLKERKIVDSSTEDNVEVYKLTKKGKNKFKKIAEKIDDDLLERIKKLKIGSERLGYKGLLRYVYFNYPNFVDKSEIREEIFGGE